MLENYSLHSLKRSVKNTAQSLGNMPIHVFVTSDNLTLRRLALLESSVTVSMLSYFLEFAY